MRLQHFWKSSLMPCSRDTTAMRSAQQEVNLLLGTNKDEITHLGAGRKRCQLTVCRCRKTTTFAQDYTETNAPLKSARSRLEADDLSWKRHCDQSIRKRSLWYFETMRIYLHKLRKAFSSTDHIPPFACRGNVTKYRTKSHVGLLHKELA